MKDGYYYSIGPRYVLSDKNLPFVVRIGDHYDLNDAVSEKEGRGNEEFIPIMLRNAFELSSDAILLESLGLPVFKNPECFLEWLAKQRSREESDELNATGSASIAPYIASRWNKENESRYWRLVSNPLLQVTFASFAFWIEWNKRYEDLQRQSFFHALSEKNLFW